jgi:hypothetical protein
MQTELFEVNTPETLGVTPRYVFAAQRHQPIRP